VISFENKKASNHKGLLAFSFGQLTAINQNSR
jgi:hypothetical protein